MRTASNFAAIATCAALAAWGMVHFWPSSLVACGASACLLVGIMAMQVSMDIPARGTQRERDVKAQAMLFALASIAAAMALAWVAWRVAK